MNSTIRENSIPYALYNPGLLDPATLLAEFTARRPLLVQLLDIIKENPSGHPPQHGLVIGPRGMGKTTLLCAIAASITLREPELNRQWQPVLFDEESRRVGDLTDFWLECIRQWEGAVGISSNRLDKLLDLGPDIIEQRARECFLELVEASGKRALLLIDNFNDVLEAIRDEQSHCRLREFLMSDSRVMIIGAATRWFRDVTSMDRPFYEFFRSFELKALTLEEMQDCLTEVARLRGDQRVTETLREKPGSVRALHLLTGGNPRLIRTFHRMLSEGLHGELKQQLERLIDDYTPYVKAILDALSNQQQKVLDAIALHWNPCDVATIARQTRLPSNQVSAQLKELTKRGMVCESVGMSRTKKRAYMMADRFSNIHYLMRHGRAGQSRLHWFVMTLRVLFDDQEFADSAANVVRLTANSGVSGGEELQLARSVLEYAESPKARHRFLDRVTGSQEFDKEINVSLAEQVCRNAIVTNPNDAVAHFKWGRLLRVHLQRFEEARAAYQKAIELDPHYAMPWNNLGLLLTDDFGEHAKARAAYQKAIELDPQDSFPWNNLGILLMDHFGEHDKAKSAFQKAIELDPQNGRPWNNLGLLLTEHFGEHEKAKSAYQKAIELDPQFAFPWNNLGTLLTNHFGEHEEAKAAYLKAMELDRAYGYPHSNLARLLTETGHEHECRNHATLGLQKQPDDEYCQQVFRAYCFEDADVLRQALPTICEACRTSKQRESLSTFAVEVWLALATIAGADAAEQLLSQQPEDVQAMFESVHDAFRASLDAKHLDRLAPERRAVAIELMARFAKR